MVDMLNIGFVSIDNAQSLVVTFTKFYECGMSEWLV